MRVDESFNDTDEWLCKCDDISSTSKRFSAVYGSNFVDI